MARGAYTEQVKEYMEEFLGRESSVTELRLIPYIHHLSINNGKVDPNRVTPEERKILSEWKKRGWVTGGASERVWILKEFYDFICEVLYMSYMNSND